MSTPYAAAIARAAASTPQGIGAVPILPNRTLLIDGDGLAYYCAGKDGSSVEDARAAMLNKIRSAAKAVGAARTIVLLTASGSPKGSRYAVATVKPYQGQRTSSRRPANWQYLRDFMEAYSGFEFDVHLSYDQEADDLWAQYAYPLARPHEDLALYTQDKDGRHTCCLHLDWVTHSQIVVPPGTWSIVHNDKVYGRKWFWLQMLHGDTADHIPGLPKYGTTDAKGNPAFKPVGEVTAANALADTSNEEEAKAIVTSMYRSFYDKDSWQAAMQEQAILLWMQRTPSPLDVFTKGAPLQDEYPHPDIEQRIKIAKELNALAATIQS